MWAFVALPGVLVGLVPSGYVLVGDVWPAGGWYWLGLVPGVLGAALGLACIRQFFVEGRGTLAPWDPPKDLVVRGAYRWVRNPMYLGAAGALVGWAVVFGSVVLSVYACVLVTTFHLRTVCSEEPKLREQFGQEYEEYCRQVPRWIPRLRPVPRRS